MENSSEVRLVEILHKLGLTQEMVRNHVIRPEHVKAATLHIELRDAGDGDKDPSGPPPPSGIFYRLNVPLHKKSLNSEAAASPPDVRRGSATPAAN